MKNDEILNVSIEVLDNFKEVIKTEMNREARINNAIDYITNQVINKNEPFLATWIECRDSFGLSNEDKFYVKDQCEKKINLRDKKVY